jgi:hypothetical protein
LTNSSSIREWMCGAVTVGARQAGESICGGTATIPAANSSGQVDKAVAFTCFEAQQSKPT